MNLAIVIGANHHNTLGVIRSLGEKQITVHLILIGPETSFVIKSKYVARTIFVNSKDEIVDCLLKNYSSYPQKIVVFPCNDKVAEELDIHYLTLSRYFTFQNIKCNPGRISFAMSKDYMQEIAQKTGLETPDYCVILSGEPLPKSIKFPCIIKTLKSVGGTKSDIIICHDREELLKAIKLENDYLVEDFIEKDYELNVLGCSINHGETVYIPGVIRKVREWPDRSGSSSFSVMSSLEEYGLSRDAIVRFIGTLGYEGLFSIEFVSKDGINYFLEVNLRNDGNGYIPTAMGINLPYFYYSYAIGNSNEYDTTSLNYPFYFMEDFTDIRHVFCRNISLATWIRSYKKVDCFLCYNVKDPKPFYRKLRNVLLDYWKSFFNKLKW